MRTEPKTKLVAATLPKEDVMLHASHAVIKTCTLLSGFLLAASMYAAVMYYPLHQLCAFCVTRAHWSAHCRYQSFRFLCGPRAI